MKDVKNFAKEQMKSIGSDLIKKRIRTVILNILGKIILLYIKVMAIIFLLVKINIINLNDLYNNAVNTFGSGSSSTPIIQTITGDTYYASSTGSATNSGESESEPLTLSEGIKKLKPGDGLIIAQGTYTDKITISKQGEEGKPIIIRADGEVVFDGKGGGGTLLKVSSDAKYVNIEGITFKNLEALETRAIYLEHSCNNINILDCNFEDIKANPPTSEDSAANAIYFEGSGSTREKAIDHVIIQNCTLKNICAGYSEAISIDGNCTNIILDGITATAPDVKSNIAICVCGHDENTNPGHPEVNRPEHVQIINCNVSDCVSPYGQDSYGIYVDGGYDVKIIGNTVTNSEGGIEVGAEKKSEKAFKERETESIIVQNNTVDECKKAMQIGGWDGKGTVSDVQVTGNTFSKSGNIELSKRKNITIKGNTLNGSKITYSSKYENASGDVIDN